MPTRHPKAGAVSEIPCSMDGHCFYNAILLSLQNGEFSESFSVDFLRKVIYLFVSNHNEKRTTGSYKEAATSALAGMGKKTCGSSGWGGDNELGILASILYIRIDVYENDNKQWISIGDSGPKIYLINRSNHFNSLIPVKEEFQLSHDTILTIYTRLSTSEVMSSKEKGIRERIERRKATLRYLEAEGLDTQVIKKEIEALKYSI